MVGAREMVARMAPLPGWLSEAQWRAHAMGGPQTAMSTDQAAATDADAQADTRVKSRPRRRGRMTVFGKWCKGCGLCIAFCPQQVFEVDAEGHPIVAHEEKCTACNWCYYHCPDCAIFVELLDEEGQGIGVAP